MVKISPYTFIRRNFTDKFIKEEQNDSTKRNNYANSCDVRLTGENWLHIER